MWTKGGQLQQNKSQTKRVNLKTAFTSLEFEYESREDA